MLKGVLALLCAVLVSAPIPEGSPVPEAPCRAAYLDFGPRFEISVTSPYDSLAEKLKDDSFVFFESVEYQDLIGCGMLSSAESAEEQRLYMTDVNGFEEFRKGQMYMAQPGDFLFRMEHGKAVSWDVVREEFLLQDRNLRVIHVDYPRYEDLVYLYLRDSMNFSRNVCCGIMSNLYFESDFLPTAREETGQHGFGICQWSNTRQDEFFSCCAKEKKHPESLYTQLDFMRWELENKIEFDSLLNMMLNCTHDGDGAYDVAHVFCLFFEDPYDSDQRAEDRGAFAQDSFYVAYSGA